MTKRFTFITGVLAFVLIATACSSSVSNKQSGSRKFFVQPVFLNVVGIEKDTSIRRLFEETFAKNKVQLITNDEMKARLEKEARRVGEKAFTKDSKLNNADDAMKAIANEHRYISNMLSIRLELHDKDDSLMIYKVSWSNMPFPIIIKQPYGTKSREINLANHSYSIKENVISIVDSILYSKELK